MADSSGTIDITDVVNAIESTSESLLAQTLFADIVAVPGLQWLALPIFSQLLMSAINWATGRIVGYTFMQAFFANTAIRKASQASDYIEAKQYKDGLPQSATPAEIAEAELKEIVEFDRFVAATN